MRSKYVSINFILEKAGIYWFYKARLIPPGLEPGIFRVLGERDNHYTTESYYAEG